MDRKKAEKLIQQLGEQMDLQRVLESAGMAPNVALKALKSGCGRAQLRALKILTRIHIEVLAHRYGPLALSKLCHLLSEEKPELQMKGALAVLAIAGPDESALQRRKGREDKGVKSEKLPAIDSAQATELLRTIAEVLTERRRKACMGPPPRAKSATSASKQSGTISREKP